MGFNSAFKGLKQDMLWVWVIYVTRLWWNAWPISQHISALYWLVPHL